MLILRFLRQQFFYYSRDGGIHKMLGEEYVVSFHKIKRSKQRQYYQKHSRERYFLRACVAAGFVPHIFYRKEWEKVKECQI